MLSLAGSVWSIAKAISFVDSLLGGSSEDDVALVKRFAAVDELVKRAIAVTLVGLVLVVFARWRSTARSE